MFKSTVSAYIVVLAGICSGPAGALGNTQEASPVVLGKRQYFGGVEGGLPGVEGMNARYSSPFAAFWNQGLVPGQGFPQIGMSAYGYGLPGLGLAQFLNPDVQILRGVGEGEITEDDLKHLDNSVNGYDRFKEHSGDVYRQPDPAFPGHFKNEGYGDERNGDRDEDESHGGRYKHGNGALSAAQMNPAAGAALCAASLALLNFAALV